MAKKVAKKSKKGWMPNSLEDPVHNLIGYGVLLVMAIVVLMIVLRVTGNS
ncbi:MAG TPA: hypothetical protein VMR41_04865 [Patescibacteria group bacterium]|nr:hypothetical protein [Patescibacteria group bacterium]